MHESMTRFDEWIDTDEIRFRFDVKTFKTVNNMS